MPSSKLNLLKLAIGRLTNSHITSPGDDDDRCSQGRLDIDALHKGLLRGVIADPSKVSVKQEGAPVIKTEPLVLYVKTLDGRKLAIYTHANDRIKDIKNKIQKKEEIPAEQQSLIFAGRRLEDDHTLDECNIQNENTLHLVVRLRDGVGGAQQFTLAASSLSPKHDYDFTDIDDKADSATFVRGNEVYERPCGWQRFALNVLNKYDGYDNNKWLGMTGTDPAEWPVSYHGTSSHNGMSIGDEGAKIAQIGTNSESGYGIYSTPQVAIAERYASIFEDPTTGKKYQVIIQNRVNPTTLQKSDSKEYFVSPKDSDVRPYGICVKELEVPVEVVD